MRIPLLFPKNACYGTGKSGSLAPEMSPLDWFRFRVSGKTFLHSLAAVVLAMAAAPSLGRTEGSADSDGDGEPGKGPGISLGR